MGLKKRVLKRERLPRKIQRADRGRMTDRNREGVGSR